MTDTLQHPSGLRTQRPSARSQTRRTALVVFGLGLATFFVFYVPIAYLQSNDSSAAAIGMQSMHMDRMKTFWSFPVLQAAGLAALVWAYLGIAFGLLEGRQPTDWSRMRLPVSQRLRLHRQISLLVIGLILVHALATAFNAMGDNLLTVFVPWQANWSQAIFAYNLGIFALYLAILVGPTYYLRRMIGVRRWRIVHRLAALVYILSIWHTLILGADIAYYSWIRPMLWLAQIPLLLLLVRRVIEQAAQPGTGNVARLICGFLAAAAGLSIAGVIIIVATGLSDSVVTGLHF